MKYTVAIVDDHILIANALASFVNKFDGFEVVFECENGKDLQDTIAASANIPDIVMLDISMPVLNGFETAAWLTKTHPKTLILVLSMQDDDMSVIQMVHNGASGYMLKNTSPNELESALTSLVTKGKYFPDWASSILENTIFDSNYKEKLNVVISSREKEFLNYVTTELSYIQIADRMCCSPRTVEGYRDKLCEKLQIKTRVGLAVYAITHKGFLK